MEAKPKIKIPLYFIGYKNVGKTSMIRRLTKGNFEEQYKATVGIDYSQIKGIRLEARQKLNKYRPYSIGQASRISGVSPADISVLLIYLEQYRKEKSEKK